MRRLRQVLAARATPIEVALAGGLVVAGVATFNLGAALVTAGLLLLAPIIWSAVRKAR